MRIFVTGATGFIGSVIVPASSALTRERLGWRPAGQPGLIADLERMRYFASDAGDVSAAPARAVR